MVLIWSNQMNFCSRVDPLRRPDPLRLRLDPLPPRRLNPRRNHNPSLSLPLPLRRPNPLRLNPPPSHLHSPPRFTLVPRIATQPLALILAAARARTPRTLLKLPLFRHLLSVWKAIYIAT